MLPSVDLRIQNMIKALREVVLPALPEGEKLARDQALLVIGHLGMLGEQWRFVLPFEAGSLDALSRLAQDLLAISCGDAAPDRPVQLQNAIAIADAAPRDDLRAIESATITLGRAVDRVISGDGSAEPMGQSMMDAVLAYGAMQSWRERCWFAANGLDPDRKELPTIVQMLERDRLRLQPEARITPSPTPGLRTFRASSERN